MVVTKKEEEKIIRNKYDIYNVEFHINEFFIEYMEKNLKAVKSETKEYYKQALGAILSIFILLSYFHKTPFPLDKPQIVIFTLLYFLFTGILELYKKYYIKNIFAEFYVSKSSLPKNLLSVSKFFVKDLGFIVMSSKIKLFSNEYTLVLEVNGSVAERVVEYNEFVFCDGRLAEGKLEKLFVEVMNELK